MGINNPASGSGITTTDPQYVQLVTCLDHCRYQLTGQLSTATDATPYTAGTFCTCYPNRVAQQYIPQPGSGIYFFDVGRCTYVSAGSSTGDN